LKNIQLRRLKEDVLELPQKFPQTVYVDMYKEQEPLYKEVLAGLQDKIDLIMLSPNPLVQFTRLRQVVGTPQLVSSTVQKSAKLDKLVELVDEIASRGEQCLIFSNWAEVVQEAINAGIKVILVDSVIDKEIANGVVATDNFKAGKELGTFAKTILKPDSKIGVVAHVKGSSTATEREDGIREGLGEDQNRIQDIVYCNSSYDLASDLTEKMLKERPEIDVVIGTNEYSAVGAARGVKKMGMEDQVKVVGFDNSVEQIQLLEAGVFQGIVIQKPFNIGYLGVEQAVKAIEGYPMEYNLDSGCKLITKENMYEEENQRLLYSFSGQQ
jgi:ABC-type sugar transport system substrate-binding protein